MKFWKIFLSHFIHSSVQKRWMGQLWGLWKARGGFTVRCIFERHLLKNFARPTIKGDCIMYSGWRGGKQNIKFLLSNTEKRCQEGKLLEMLLGSGFNELFFLFSALAFFSLPWTRWDERKVEIMGIMKSFLNSSPSPKRVQFEWD